MDDEPAWNGRSFPGTVAHDLAGFDIGTALIHVPDTGWVHDDGVRFGQIRLPAHLQNIDAVSLILGARRDAHGRAKQPIHLCYGSAEPLHLLDHLAAVACTRRRPPGRSEEHTSELQSLMRISYAVFCLKKKKPYTSLL